jgi:hypothetical protein
MIRTTDAGFINPFVKGLLPGHETFDSADSPNERMDGKTGGMWWSQFLRATIILLKFPTFNCKVFFSQLTLFLLLLFSLDPW